MASLAIMGIAAAASGIGTAISAGMTARGQDKAIDQQTSVNQTNLKLQQNNQNYATLSWQRNVDLYKQSGLPGWMAETNGGGSGNVAFNEFPKLSQMVSGNNFSTASIPGNLASDFGNTTMQQVLGIANYQYLTKQGFSPKVSTTSQTDRGDINPTSTFSTQTEPNPQGTSMTATPKTPEQLWGDLGGTVPSTSTAGTSTASSSTVPMPDASAAAEATPAAMPIEE